MYKKFFKRFFDLVLSLVAIIVLFPSLLILSIIVRIKMGTPIIFKQERPGLNEKIFTLYKFRTMNNEKDQNGELLPDSERLTKFGLFLRKSSLDELPELFNILKGDMSIVGPRPLAVKYLPYYNAEEKKRHNVRPGLTGLAQVNGRNASKWEDRFKYDLEYIEKISIIIDIKIIIMTIFKVLKSEDIIVRGEGENKDFDKYRIEQGGNK